MWHRRLLHNLRTALFIAVACGVVAAGVSLWWANRTGLPDTWRTKIEEELGKHGAHVQIDSLTYIPFKGLIARSVRIFSDKERTKEVSRLERVVLDFNKSQLIKQKLQLTKLELSDARLSLPVDPHNPDSALLEVSDLNGTILMPGGRLLEVRDVRGKIGGIEVIFGARMLGYRQETGDHKDDPNEGKRREMIARVIRELERWNFDPAKPPVLRVFAEGDLSDKSTILARMSLQASNVGKNGHVLDEIGVQGTLTGHLLTVTSAWASDPRGDFDGRLDYDIKTGEGRFDILSGLEIPGLLKAWIGLPPIPQISFGGDQSVEAEGDFHFGPDGKAKVRVTGKARCESVMLRGVSFDTVESAFSWSEDGLYLRDAILSRKDGLATGKVLIQGPVVQMALKSTLPTAVYQPFFRGQPLEIVINDFGAKEGTKINVELEGGFDTRDRHSWAYAGRGQVDRVTFKGVPVEMAKCSFALSSHELDFHNGTVIFDYTDYALREAFQGPGKGTVSVGGIRYNAGEKQVHVDDVEGSIWAAPLVRLFAPKIADSLEIYRFHQPPALRGSGVVDVTPQGRTALTVGFNSQGEADYKLLGENVTLHQPSGEVVIRGGRVLINDLKARAFGGPVAATLSVANGRLDAEANWSRINLAEVAATYGFQIKGGGSATGRIEFNCTDGKIATLDGKGLLGLEKTELFSVPMFGPLSSLVANALGGKAGYQQAKDAFLNFEIRNGVMSSNDFYTSTSSLVFTGDGSIDLATRHIDMTMRMNARGFLRLVTLPLRPFYGLFQFHGVGPMRQAEWKSELFTAPPDDQNETLLAPPKARVVAPPSGETHGAPKARPVRGRR
jgi:hypothetical protein